MPVPAFVAHFADLPDPRINRCKRHALLDMLVIAFLAVLCGAEGWEEIQPFGQAKRHFLKQRLGLCLENGIPTDDTFPRVFARLDPTAFERCFGAWVKTLADTLAGEVISLDGQRLRPSFDTAFGQNPLCLVRAWASERRLVLGTLPVEAASNQIPAVQALLCLLELSGGILTADALPCHKETAAQIVAQEGEYGLALKDHQAHLHQDVSAVFERHKQPQRRRDWVKAAPERAFCPCTQTHFGHARQEKRVCRGLTLAPNDPDWADVQQEGTHLRSFVQRTRTRILPDKTSVETLYYMSSVPRQAPRLARAIRSHWQIENCLHPVLDVGMRADACRIRRDHGPGNRALLRSIALNLVRQERSHKAGVRAKQKRAGWDQDYLLQLLAQASNTP